MFTAVITMMISAANALAQAASDPVNAELA